MLKKDWNNFLTSNSIHFYIPKFDVQLNNMEHSNLQLVCTHGFKTGYHMKVVVGVHVVLLLRWLLLLAVGS